MHIKAFQCIQLQILYLISPMDFLAKVVLQKIGSQLQMVNHLYLSLRTILDLICKEVDVTLIIYLLYY